MSDGPEKEPCDLNVVVGELVNDVVVDSFVDDVGVVDLG